METSVYGHTIIVFLRLMEKFDISLSSGDDELHSLLRNL